MPSQPRRPAKRNATAAYFKRRMAACERAFKAGNRAVLLDVVVLCAEKRRALPAWAVPGVVRAVQVALRSEIAKYRRDQIHFERWSAVTELRERRHELAQFGYKPTWDAAYENAAKALKDGPAVGSAAAIRASYLLVKRALNKGQGRRFLQLLSFRIIKRK